MRETGTIQEVNLLQLLPPALTFDENALSIAQALANGLQENAVLAKEAGIYYRIDELSEPILDILAVDLHVDWYDSNATIDEKRAVIASSVFVHRHMGTPAAIHRVLDDNFGGGEVMEWFDYGGKHHHFEVKTDNIEMVNNNFERFISVLSKAKRASTVLESIKITQRENVAVKVGMASKTRLQITSKMEPLNVSNILNWLTDESGNVLLDGKGKLLVLD